MEFMYKYSHQLSKALDIFYNILLDNRLVAFTIIDLSLCALCYHRAECVGKNLVGVFYP